jgi:hypothetical protein
MQSVEEITKRIVRLEKAVFGGGARFVKSEGNFRGIVGGIRLLQTKSFFAKKRTAIQVKAELEQLGYHYSIAAIQTTLNRASVKKGPLTSLREDGKKVYVGRK